jgi:hypothetical protein
MTVPLHLHLDEMDLIADASDHQSVGSFYCDDFIDSDLLAERGRAIVHRVNVHEQMLRALEADIILYEEDLPVTFLESPEIESALHALTGATAEVRSAINDAHPSAMSSKGGK